MSRVLGLAATASVVLLLAGQSDAAEPVVMASANVVWELLSPARGDMSQRAGALWRDRNEEAANGFVLTPADGFESPPHIHRMIY